MITKAFVTIRLTPDIESQCKYVEMEIPEEIPMSGYNDYVRAALLRDWNPAYSNFVNIQYTSEHSHDIEVVVK